MFISFKYDAGLIGRLLVVPLPPALTILRLELGAAALNDAD